MLIRVQPEYESDRRLSSFIVLANDITERKKAEDELRESERRFRALAEASSEALYHMDPDWTEMQYLQSVDFLADVKTPNPDWMQDYIPLDEQPRVMAAIHEAIQNKDVFEMEHRVFREDGTVGWIWSRAVPLLNENGEILEWFGAALDVTERKQIEDQLRQAQMEAIGRLAGGTAHEFNNMLSVIIGYAEILNSRLDKESSLSYYVQEIQKAALRSAEVTNQLLGYSRKQMVQPKVINLNRTIEAQVDMLGRLIGEDFEIRFYPGDNLWPVRIDPHQVSQILSNLAVNARDAIYNIGQITIITGNKHTSKSDATPDLPQGEYVHLTFIDIGSGIDEETMKEIFEPYFTTKEVGKGTGLGLATVYGIVRQNNGFIFVESKLGKETTFTIYFPRSRDMVEEESSSESSVQEGKETILVVEDEAQLMDLAELFLKEAGYNVLKANNPNEAIDIALQNRGIDLLLSDVVMPEMNGKALQLLIKRLHPDIRTLFMSGYSEDVIAEKTLEIHTSDLIRKPFTLEKLTNKVREILNR